MEVFELQSREYKMSILSPQIPVLSVEAACTQGWDKVSAKLDAIRASSNNYYNCEEHFG